jgi:hypothetical protein
VTRKDVLIFVGFIGSLFCLFYLWDMFFVRLGLVDEGIRNIAVVAASVLSTFLFLAFCHRLYVRIKKEVRRENIPSKSI